MAAMAVKLNIEERYADQLERSAELFAQVLVQGMTILAGERYDQDEVAEVVPLAIARVLEEIGDIS